MANCSDPVGVFEVQGGVSTTDAVFFPAGALLAYIGMAALDFGLIVRLVAGNAELVPAYQLIKVRPAAPETPVAVSSATWRNATGPYHERQAFSSTEYYWLQPGVLARVKPGGAETPGYFQATLVLSKAQCGRIVGQGQRDMYPKNSNSLNLIVPASDFVPTIGVDKFRAIVVGTDCNDIDIGWFCRTAIDRETPNAWQQIGSWSTLSTANVAINTGASGTDLSIPAGANPSSNALLQIGFASRMKSGGTNPHGLFRWACGLTFS